MATKPSIKDISSYNTKSVPVRQSTDLNAWFQDNIQDPLLRDIEDFQERDSGWTLQAVRHLTVNINKYNPIRGSAYIELPPPIEQRKACVNVRTRGDDCFKWAVLSALFPAAENPYRISQYRPYEDRMNTQGLVFPLMPRDVPKFEKLNSDLSVNFYV